MREAAARLIGGVWKTPEQNDRLITYFAELRSFRRGYRALRLFLDNIRTPRSTADRSLSVGPTVSFMKFYFVLVVRANNVKTQGGMLAFFMIFSSILVSFSVPGIHLEPVGLP